MKNQWIGIQFNLVDGGVIRSKESFKAMGIEFTSNHVVIKFTQKELKKFNLKVDSEKLRIILSLLREYLAKSDYTNIYTYLEADKLSLQKSLLNQSDLIKTDNYNKNLQLWTKEGFNWMQKKYGFKNKWDLNFYVKSFYDRFFDHNKYLLKYKI